MRQYLFRGKRVDNGEWVEGFYAELADGTPIIQRDTTEEFYSHEALPETVGQWTGLYDRNEARIWENDVVKNDQGVTGQVVYILGCYSVEDDPEFGGSSRILDFNMSAKNRKQRNFQEDQLLSVEVIGNAIDTPSLLNDKT